jgi:hypothetical protein
MVWANFIISRNTFILVKIDVVVKPLLDIIYTPCSH